MATETVTILKQEYKKHKKQAKVDYDLVKQIVESLEDIKAGRIKRVY